MCKFNIFRLFLLLISCYSAPVMACTDFSDCTGSTPYCSLTDGYCCAGSGEYACSDSSGTYCSPNADCSTGGGGGGGGNTCADGTTCSGSTPYCSLTSGYCCGNIDEYVCQGSNGNYCTTDSTCGSGGGGGGGGGGNTCANGTTCSGSTPYCSLTSGYCCGNIDEYVCQGSNGNYCTTDSTCGSGGGGGGNTCSDGTTCSGSTPYCSLTSGYCCGSADQYVCQGSNGKYCTSDSTCGTGGGGGGGNTCADGTTCSGSTPYCSLTSGYCCGSADQYVCQGSNGKYCTSDSTCGTGGGGGGGNTCADGTTCSGSTPYCSLTSGYCCGSADQYVCQGSNGKYCTSDSSCGTGGGGGSGGNTCADGSTCSGSTPYCSLTYGYCCGNPGEYVCQNSSGNYCTTDSSCGGNGNFNTCQDGVNCNGATPYCSLTNGYCCAGANEYACTDANGHQFCSTSSSCSNYNGNGNSGCTDFSSCTGSTPYCSLTAGYCCAGANEYACKASNGSTFCSKNSNCSTNNNTGGNCHNGYSCSGKTPYCSLTTGYCCGDKNEYACKDASGKLFCSKQSDCKSTPPAPAPTLSFSANPSIVKTGHNTTLQWSSNHANSCVASGAWSGNYTASGSHTIAKLSSSNTYTLTCSGSGGSVSKSITVTVEASPQPIIQFKAKPISVNYGGSTTLHWSSSNAYGCSASGSWSGNVGKNGQRIIKSLRANASFTLTCAGAGGSTSQSEYVFINPPVAPMINFSATPKSVTKGGSSTLRWSVTHANSCQASGNWNGNKSLTGTRMVKNITVSETFTLTCSGSGGTSNHSSVTLTPITAPKPVAR